MDDVTEVQKACFLMISYVGAAKSKFIEAVRKAEEGDFDGATSLLAEGDKDYLQGHDVHAKILARDAAGDDPLDFSILLVHAEDQMMSAETIRSLVDGLISICRRLPAEKSA
jgi:PTS system cellobiose-specific IIA component